MIPVFRAQFVPLVLAALPAAAADNKHAVDVHIDPLNLSHQGDELGTPKRKELFGAAGYRAPSPPSPPMQPQPPSTPPSEPPSSPPAAPPPPAPLRIMVSCSHQGAIYDSTTNAWASTSQPQMSRSGGSLAALDGYVYAMGGGGTASQQKAVERYDPASDSWQYVQSMNQPRTDFCTAAVGNYIYAVGSYQSGAHRTLERYDPQLDTWTLLTSYPDTAAYFHHRCAVLGQYIYVLGGRGSPTGDTAHALRYDTLQDTWTFAADMQFVRQNGAVASLDGKIYYFGGSKGRDYDERVDIFDPQTNSWSSGPDLPTPYNQLNGAAVGDFIYAIGGSYSGGETQRWDPTTASWDTSPPSLPGGWAADQCCGAAVAIV